MRRRDFKHRRRSKKYWLVLKKSSVFRSSFFCLDGVDLEDSILAHGIRLLLHIYEYLCIRTIHSPSLQFRGAAAAAYSPAVCRQTREDSSSSPPLPFSPFRCLFKAGSEEEKYNQSLWQKHSLLSVGELLAPSRVN